VFYNEHPQAKTYEKAQSQAQGGGSAYKKKEGGYRQPKEKYYAPKAAEQPVYKKKWLAIHYLLNQRSLFLVNTCKLNITYKFNGFLKTFDFPEYH